MKNSHIFLYLIAFFYTSIVISQTITLPLSKGGEYNGGTILKVNAIDGSHEVAALQGLIGTRENGIPKNNPANNSSSSIYYESSNNSFYILAKEGFRQGDMTSPAGVLFRYDRNTSKTELIHQFEENSLLGTYPHGNLTKVGTKLYGVTEQGGANNYGCIFSIDITTNTYNVEFSFNGTTDGGYPSCGMFLEGDVFYGAGRWANGTAGQSYFTYNTSSNTFTSIYLADSQLNEIRGIFKHNNILYISNGSDILKLNLSNPGEEVSFYYIGNGANLGLGSVPWEATKSTWDNRWYIPLRNGGLNGHGSIALFNFATSPGINPIHSFGGGSLGQDPTTKLVEGKRGDKFGIAQTGSTTDEAILYKIDENDTYSILHTFSNNNDGKSIQAQPIYEDGIIYGISETQGANLGGTIWSFDLTSDTFSVVAQLGYPNGMSPANGLSLNSSTSSNYFICSYGGEKGRGTLNSISGNTITKITDINDNRFVHFLHKPIVYNNKTYILGEIFSASIPAVNSVYGLTEIDVSTGNSIGNIIPIAPVSDFDDIPNTIINLDAPIVQDNNMLYGVSRQHIWSIDLSNNTYNTLYTFNTATEGNEATSFIIDNNIIYGLTNEGSTNGAGSVYKFDITNNTFTLLQAIPSGESLYGIEKLNDTLYSIHFDSTNTYSVSSMDLTSGTPTFINTQSIDNSTIGSEPGPHLSLFNNYIYGVMNSGGTNNLGGLFKYDITSDTLSNILSFEETTGYYGFNSELLITAQSLGLNDLNINFKLNLYPNPSIGIIQTNLEKIDSCVVRTVDGKTVVSEIKGSTISISKNTPGVYFITIKADGKLYNSKVILK
ncbi:MAG: T9SS type A sorting domain-containing protein [Flavobacteriaceae bacterium]|nr:T9SS type A sorting domain-containing protein [Flavobacteriaceae bacterium]